MLEVVRAGRSDPRSVRVRSGEPLRRALRLAGLAPEGVLVLEGELPVPLDRPLAGPVHLKVVPTFSGG